MSAKHTTPAQIFPERMKLEKKTQQVLNKQMLAVL